MVCSSCMFLTPMLSATINPVATAHATGLPAEMLASHTRFTLDNGMTVLLHEDHTADLASIQFWVGTGSSHEQEMLGAGLSHFIEHMIFKGTPTRGPAEITRAINDVGGSINAYTSVDRTVFFTDLPAANWRTGFDVLADAVQNAVFPEDEWQREKEVIIREMAMYRDNPDSEVSRLLLENAFRVHPYRVPVIGYEDIFLQLTREDLLNFFQRHYTPDNIILVIAGAIDKAEIETAVRETFKDFARRPRAAQSLPKEPYQLSERVTRRTGPHQVGRMALAWHTVSLEHPDAPALDMLATITGSGRSSRMVRRIVEREKLAHNIEVWSFTPAEPGLFGINAVFDPAREQELLAAIDEEIDEWQRGVFTSGEIDKARRITLSRITQELQTVHGQARNLASGELYAADPLFMRNYLQRLEKITPADLTETARRYLRINGRTRAVLLPATAESDKPAVKPARITPEIQKTELNNGLPLLTMENRRLPLVNICIVFNGGLRFENEDNNGITDMMAELLTRGSQRRSAEQIAELTDSRGASISAFAGQNSFGLQAQCLAEDADMLMDLLADCLLNPSFTSTEVDKRRTVQLSLIAQQRESPIFLAQENLRQMLFPAHPYRFTTEGRPEVIERITSGDLRDYHARMVVSGNAVLAVFGDISHDNANRLAERYFRRMPKGLPPAPERAEPMPPELPARMIRHEPKEQTILMMGFPGVTLTDRRMEALNVLQTILSGLSSDMVVNIRDKEGLAYFAGAFSRPAVEPGLFAVYAGIHYPALERVEQLMTEELQRLTTGGPRTEELDRAREQILARHLHNLQINAETARDCALHELYGLGYDYSFNMAERLRELTPADLAAAAASIFTLDRAALSVVAPEK